MGTLPSYDSSTEIEGAALYLYHTRCGVSRFTDADEQWMGGSILKRITSGRGRLQRFLSLLILGLMVTALAACQPLLLEPASVGVVTTPDVASEEVTGGVALENLAEAQQLLVTRAIETVATELNLAPDAVRFVAITDVDWPDASLGCPQDGQMYAQMITRGFLILLEADGAEYEVHTGADGNSQVIFCRQQK